MVRAMTRSSLHGAILALIVAMLAWAAGGLGPAQALGGSASGDASAALSNRVVMVLGSRGNSCSGTAIRPDTILTAAHCVRGAKETAIAYFENGSPVLQRARRTIIHPRATTNYRRTIDAALVILDRPLPERFEMTELDAPTIFREPGEAAIIAGFGLQRSSNLKSGGTLRAADASLLPPRSRRVMRIGVGGPDTLLVCKGDSGGPVFDPEMRLIGIVFGTEVDKQPALCGEVGQAIRVAPIRDWIDETLQRHSAAR
jgi:hypothetical protein